MTAFGPVPVGTVVQERKMRTAWRTGFGARDAVAAGCGITTLPPVPPEDEEATVAVAALDPLPLDIATAPKLMVPTAVDGRVCGCGASGIITITGGAAAAAATTG